MITGIFNTTLTGNVNADSVLISVQVLTNSYSQEATPVGDPISREEDGETITVQPVEYEDQYIVTSDTFTYQIPEAEQAEGRVPSDYWDSIKADSRYIDFVGVT